ncbi:MAG TPA: ABC transporter ATP-binding protein [Pirellulales bacterium]|jgi:ATP-binding cassette subfamily B protein|nr:ABC transporter ATP-binding protein [Pirellulales bacterium]
MSHVRSRTRFSDYRKQLRLGRRATDPAQGGLPAREKQRSFWQLFTAFWGMLAGYRLPIVFSLVTLTIATLLALVSPAATKLMIDNVLAGKPLEWPWTIFIPEPDSPLQLLWWLALGVIGISLAETAVRLWGRWYATRTVTRVQVATRKKAFDHAVRLPLGRVHQLKSGGTASILRDDAGSIPELIFSMLYNPWRAIVQLLGSLIVLAVVDWRLLLGSLVLFPVILMTHRTWIGRIRPLYRDIRIERQNIDSSATEAFAGMRVVRAFGRQRSETARFTRANHFMARQQLHVWWWARAVEVVWEVIIPLSSAALLLYGGSRVLSGNLTLGELMMFLVYLAMLLSPLAVLATSAAALQSSLAGLDRVLDLLAEPQEMSDNPGAITIRKNEVAGRIMLRDVTFRYPGSSEFVLEEINLDVRPGETVALVGRSGAGKTTLTNLVARFYDPSAGSVELDGLDLREINVESYRRLLGIVEQDVFLFDGTVNDNIAYAVRGADPALIERAARAANAHEFIAKLDHGYDTIIGERGVRLSGGQRQRIAIARALLADPRILILDEATSNLDSESERLIQQSLLTLMRGRTSFVIAHRLSTIAQASRIVVLDHGRIVEMGTHRDLLAQSGLYRQMVEIQTLGNGHLDPANPLQAVGE